MIDSLSVPCWRFYFFCLSEQNWEGNAETTFCVFQPPAFRLSATLVMAGTVSTIRAVPSRTNSSQKQQEKERRKGLDPCITTWWLWPDTSHDDFSQVENSPFFRPEKGPDTPSTKGLPTAKGNINYDFFSSFLFSLCFDSFLWQVCKNNYSTPSPSRHENSWIS